MCVRACVCACVCVCVCVRECMYACVRTSVHIMLSCIVINLFLPVIVIYLNTLKKI